MSDLISRQEAIDALNRLCPYPGEWSVNGLGLCKDAIANLPSIDAVPYTNDEIQRMQDIEQAQIQKAYDIGKADAKQQWIPVEERLPEKENKSYWICTDGGYQCQCRWTNDMYGLGANEYSKWGWHVMDKPQYSRVIAWMPLPEPYEERKEE